MSLAGFFDFGYTRKNAALISIGGERETEDCGNWAPNRKALDLADAEATFGRDESNSICLADASVSRRHCAITMRPDGQYGLTDLESFNGTFVNGMPVKFICSNRAMKS